MMKIINSKEKENFEELIQNNLKDKLQDDDYAEKLYGALCNVIWFNQEKSLTYSCSWRYAGGLVARVRNKGEDYLNFYCSGNESIVDKEIENDLNKLGYKSLQYSKFNTIQEYDWD